jgi:tetraacyldisaccharide 4'-kinase
LAGIAKYHLFFDIYLQMIQLWFSQITIILQKKIAAIKEIKNKTIITTEKDYVRLKDNYWAQLLLLTYKSNFLMEDQFNKTILNYVGASTRNGWLYQQYK